MLNTEELELLYKTRDYFYGVDWTIGEAFDGNFLDALSTPGITFEEVIEQCKEDTNMYILLQSSDLDIPEGTVRHFDA